MCDINNYVIIAFEIFANKDMIYCSARIFCFDEKYAVNNN